MNIRPYGDCYEASLKSAEELRHIKQSYETNPVGNPEYKNLYEGLGLASRVEVVHGTVVPPTDIDAGRLITHAWVEVGGLVIETSLGQMLQFPAEEYYELHKAIPIKRYSVSEAKENAEKLGFRPWHDAQ